MKIDIHGMVPAVFTPMHENGDLNLDAIEDYVEYLAANGIKDIFALGTSGEGVSLTVEERKIVLEKWMEAAKDKIPNVIVHIGACNLGECIDLAKHATESGAQAVATMAPYFFKPSNVSLLADHIENIANAAPTTPIMYYHIPSLTGVNLNVKSLLDELHSRDVKNFAGIKFTAHDLCDFGMCCAEYKDIYTLCYGYDEQAMAGLMLGADSCVGSTFNYCPGLYKRIRDACINNDVKSAREDQYHSVSMIGALFAKGFSLGVNKALMQRLSGVEVGPVRAPLERPSSEKMDGIMEMITKLGIFQWK